MMTDQSPQTGSEKQQLEELARQIYFHPHLIGHMVGYDKLTELHSQWIRYIWCPHEVPDVNAQLNTHRSLQAHRGGYKTTAIVEIGTLWWNLFHPNDRVAIIRKTFTDAAKILFSIRRHYRNRRIQELFGHIHGEVPFFIREKDEEILMSFKHTVTREGTATAHGIDGSITGTHYDKIIGDDIITLKDRLSAAERERTKMFVRELLTNIIDPDKQAAFIGTPWHKDDAWAMREMPQPDRYDARRTGLLSESQLQRKRETTTPLLFAINYDLKFVADADAIFSDPSYYGWVWKGLTKTAAHIDAKYAGDHTGALTVMSFKPSKEREQKLQARGWMFYDDFSTDGVLKNIAKALNTYRVRVVYLETNADKGFGGKALRRVTQEMYEAGEIDTVPTVKEYHESMNKDLKIQTYLLKYWRRIDWDHKTSSEYLAQIVDYRDKQKPNDAPDSAASLLREHFFPGDGTVNKVLFDKDAWGLGRKRR